MFSKKNNMKSKINEFPKNKLLLACKKIVILMAVFPFILGCDEGNINYKNPNLPNFPVNLSINTNLPQYSNVRFASNHIIDLSQGVGGIVIFNTGSNYMAYDLACPNQLWGAACSTRMSIDGVEAKCNCDTSENPYLLFTGQSPGQPYTLKPYRVQISGEYLIITN